MRTLLGDVKAKSASGSSASTVATWTKYHQQWFGPESAPFPTSVEAVLAVAAIMKKRCYRSFGNYLSAAKQQHIKAGGVWCQRLELAGSEATKSTSRGLGPPKQAAPLDLLEVCSLKLSGAPLVPHGPISPGALCILGTFFLTREIEISLALAKNLYREGEEIVWRLPASKTDPWALGKTRRWGCVCRKSEETVSTSSSVGVVDGDRRPCAFHAAVEHLAHLRTLFSIDGALPSELPLFPTAEGTGVTKEAVVQTLEVLASRTGQPLKDELGRRSIGGHTLRVTGAQYLAGWGLELYKLAILARWSSPVILRYVAEAPMKSITVDLRRLMVAEQMQDLLQDLQRSVQLSRESVSEMSGIVAECQLTAQHDQTQLGPSPCYVRNTASGVWHRIRRMGPYCAVNDWSSYCGWPFAMSHYEVAGSLPDSAVIDQLCSKCLWAARAVFCSDRAHSSDSELEDSNAPQKD